MTKVTIEQLLIYAGTGDKTVTQLAEYAGVGFMKMQKLCKRHQIPFKARPLGPCSTLNEDQKAYLAERYRLGASYVEIYKETGHCHRILSRYFKSIGLLRPKLTGPGATLSPEQQAHMMEMLRAGRATAEVAEAVGLSIQYVRKSRRELGLSLRPKKAVVLASKPKTMRDLFKIWEERVAA